MNPFEIPIDIDGETARNLAQTELSKGKYHPVPSWVSDVYRWLEDSLSDLIRRLENGEGNGASQGVTLLIVLLLIGALVLLIWRVGIPRLSSRHRSDAKVSLDERLSPSDYRQRASEAANAGDFSAALLELFRAMVRDLEVHTIIRPRASRTALETARIISTVMPEASADVLQVAGWFNDVAYGRQPATPDQYGLAQKLDTHLIQALKHGLAGAEAQ